MADASTSVPTLVVPTWKVFPMELLSNIFIQIIFNNVFIDIYSDNLLFLCPFFKRINIIFITGITFIIHVLWFINVVPVFFDVGFSFH